ncbi:UspA domain protein [Hymenobacter roseosalivarius DSM 11622]|uniref:UspA domain protein n=1 Tax=Hymenobacter roseosalivarius DSM 11622 TaxID=645990 RepID=A0A1W1VET4_9BACT|nr:universal stress protein [Hymenobacter roseosalivarius]SMB91858.1 UspA domain protein [Hymenobacter roseosalivarius DSM 11622]
MPAPLLLLTDFTPAADRGLAYAAAIAAELRAPLVLLHVRRTSLLDPEALSGRIPHRSEGEIAAELSSRTATLTVPVTVEISNDILENAVAAAVEQHQPQLIVLGRPDYNKPDELIDTTSLNLLRHSPVPLLVVPVMAPAKPNLCRVTIGADNQSFSLSPQVVELGQRLLSAFNATINVAHVVEPEDDDTSSLACQQVEKSGLTAGFQRVTMRGQRHLHPIDGILAAAEEDGGGLLILIARQHSILQRLFYQSVSAQVVRRSLGPVLVLPAQP